MSERNQRIILVSGPRAGKSTYARQLREQGIPTRCTDPPELVKDLEADVEYLPSGLDWSAASQYVCDQWMTKPGPWCIEGVAAARALRKWPHEHMPADRIIVFTEHHPEAEVKRGQTAMLKAVLSVWSEIAHRFEGITEYR